VISVEEARRLLDPYITPLPSFDDMVLSRQPVRQ
jgi:hypothetical protein